ncbi:hypothetical protein OHA60_10665 [Streptomyces cellulosae]|nr:hypothetical protein OHA60_10665 [Streptomyces cellulosae]
MRAPENTASLDTWTRRLPYFTAAIEEYGLDRRRTRASVLGHLDEIRFRQGDLDGALSAWSEFVVLEYARVALTALAGESVHLSRSTA